MTNVKRDLALMQVAEYRAIRGFKIERGIFWKWKTSETEMWERFLKIFRELDSDFTQKRRKK